ncbi:MAG TPA: acetyl-CoA carboxylase biotin carboxyl carrier protein [Thermoguttaceae bacterium]|nr:acetyl-CoA carboxylase biotin carboxyl carrier protein [Thermoguttaceae bacterium]
MAGSSPQQDVFDIRKIRRLVELMKEHDLSEVDLRQGDMRIQLRSDSAPVVTPPVAGNSSPLPPVAAQPVVESAPAKVEASEPVENEHVALIRSPMVGTFYTSPDPDSPVYVKVGDHVGPDTTVCIIEAMKVYNQIPAEVSGKVVAVLIENGEPVEFGQPLFRVDKRES